MNNSDVLSLLLVSKSVILVSISVILYISKPVFFFFPNVLVFVRDLWESLDT